LTSLWASATAFIAVYQSRDIGASLGLLGSSKYFFLGGLQLTVNPVYLREAGPKKS
jgi:hypothetical protein